MVVITLANGMTFYLQKQTKLELDIALNEVKNDNMDIVLVIDGGEGTGKSTFARQLGAYCGQYMKVQFGVDNIHFGLDQYIKASDENGKFHINLMDESRAILNKKRSMSNPAVRFTNYISECRDKNQIHIILLPAFHDLDNYISQWRMKYLLHCTARYANKDAGTNNPADNWQLVKGEYYLFPSDRNLMRYISNPQKYGRYNYPTSKNHSYIFKKNEVLTEAELKVYTDKKAEFRKSKYVGEDMDDDNKKIQLLVYTLNKKFNIPISRISKMLNMPSTTLREQQNRYDGDNNAPNIIKLLQGRGVKLIV